jgi:hypothetical protein
MKLLPFEKVGERVSNDYRQMPLPAHKQSLAWVIGSMATLQHKSFCILQLSKTESVTAVQRTFRWRSGIDPPLVPTI